MGVTLISPPGAQRHDATHETLDAAPQQHQRNRFATLKNGFLACAVLRSALHRFARNDDDRVTHAWEGLHGMNTVCTRSTLRADAWPPWSPEGGGSVHGARQAVCSGVVTPGGNSMIRIFLK